MIIQDDFRACLNQSIEQPDWTIDRATIEAKTIKYLEQFYDYLRQQFSDLEGAKAFYRKWKYEWDQELPPDISLGHVSLRAMAAHCSHVLEGTMPDVGCLTEYINTKYGSEIYFA